MSYITRPLKKRSAAQWQEALRRVHGTPEAVQWGRQVAFLDYPKLGVTAPGRLVANTCPRRQVVDVLVQLGYPKNLATKRMMVPRDHH
jgi:hypothetical protein